MIIHVCVFYQFQTEVNSSWQITFHVFMVRRYSPLGLVSGHNSSRKTRSSTRVPIISRSDAKSGTYRYVLVILDLEHEPPQKNPTNRGTRGIED